MARNRDAAEKTEAEFKKKARKETLAGSAVGESLDRMAGASQDITDRAPVREKLRRTARALSKR